MSDSRARAASGPTSRPVIKIYGERNTGTGYLRKLLIRNLDVECLAGGLPSPLKRIFPDSERVRDWYFRVTARRNLGWKHASAPTASQLAHARPDAPEPIFLTLTKNPYAWLLSLHRRPYHARRRIDRFEDFLCTSWETVGRENGPSSYSSPVEMWNRKNGGYLALAEYATAISCRYEDLISDPLHLLDRLCDEHGIAALRRPLRNVSEATKGSDRGRTFEDYRDYYLNERWREVLDEDCIRRINEDLDRDLMRSFGYALLGA
jgi:hypothetical protein